MQGWAEDLLTAMDSADHEHTIFEMARKAARSLGFDYCAYGLRAPLPVTNPRVIMINNYDPAWQERYLQAGYLALDPTVAHARQSQKPIVWSDEVFASAPQLWDEAQAAGLRVGWAQSNLDGHGIAGMLTLARSTEPFSVAELDAKQAQMKWLASITHLALARLILPGMRGALDSPLTGRETEVLKWTADGKTSGEVSDIMAISVNTVNFHIKNAVFKLQSANKTAAVARAMMLGLLS